MRVFAGGGDVGEKDEKCPDYTTDGSCGGIITAGEDHGGHYLQIVSTSQENKNIWNERLPVLTSLVLVLHDDQPCRHNCRTFTVKFFIV